MVWNPSTTESEGVRGNLWEPSHKAKYFLATDSEAVPWGKGEKYAGEASEIEPETVSLQDSHRTMQFFGAECLVACLSKNDPTSYCM